MRFPLKNIYVTSDYGIRSFDLYHYGTDFRAAIGESMFAVADWKCVISKLNYGSPSSPGYGEYIVLEHQRKDGTKYCTNHVHLSKRLVEVGETGKEGDLIGYTGNTPDYRNLSPHLHFEVRDCEYGEKFWEKEVRNGRSVPKYCVNPMEFFEKENSMKEIVDIKIQSRTIVDCELDTLNKLKDLLPPYEVILDKSYYKYVGYDLKYSTKKNTDAVILQTVLKELGATITCDGYFGYGTEGILFDMFGSKTVTESIAGKINEALVEKRDGVVVTNPPVNKTRNKLNPPNVRLAYGNTGTNVKNLQVIYNLVGFEDCDIDGSYGNQSKTITNKILEDNGLDQDGVYDGRVVEILKYMEVTKQSISYKYDNIYYSEIEPGELRAPNLLSK